MVTKRSLFYWVKTSNIKLQLLLLAIIIVTVFARVLPLEMQKKIVNQAIGLGKVDLLFLYCGYYLAAVVTASVLKYLITYIQTYLSQQALVKMRKDLYAHILTLPLSFFRKASPGMVVASLVTELATAGDFVGQAIAVPLTNVLTLIAFTGYMFYLNPTLGALSLASYPIILIFIPMLQRRSNRANKERVDTTRKLSSNIGEAVSGIHEIHGNGSYRIENRKYGRFVEALFKARMQWIMYKNGTKQVNNFVQALGPFALFLVGGYFVIQGRFDLGALVAFLSAYEKLYDPGKELMEFYQLYQDADVGYRRIMEYFDVEPEYLLEPPDRKPLVLSGAISTKKLSFAVGGGIQLLRDVTIELKPGEQLALVGFSGSGKSTLAQCVGQLYKYTGGSVQLDGHEVSGLTKEDIAFNMGIVAQSPFIFDGTIRENLLYSCEALRVEENGESTCGDIFGNGHKMPNLDEMIQVLQQVGIFVDVLRFGLNTVLSRENGDGGDLADKLVRVRNSFQESFGEELSDVVEFFDAERYLHHSSVAENLVFGSPNQEEFLLERLPESPYFLGFLEEAGLAGSLFDLGRDIAVTTVDILGDLPAEEIFFQQSVVRLDEFDEYKSLVDRIKESEPEAITMGDRDMLLKLALRFTPGLHKTVAIGEPFMRLILDGRLLFMEKISSEMPGAVAFYRTSDYIYNQTIQDNILFGRPRADRPKAHDRVYQSIIRFLIEEDLLERIVDIGMEFNVGTKGERLSGGQRQKLAIARILLKNPPILIMDEATSALDNASQKRI
ncbi:MAG: ABC transporter ATP-binding protein/permease, partial [Acidobacteriota bacterium]